MSNTGTHCVNIIYFVLIYSYIELRILMGEYIEELRVHNNKWSSLVLSSLGAVLFKAQTKLKKALKAVLNGCKLIVAFKSQNI